MRAYVKAFSKSYLLTLCSGRAGYPLPKALYQALRSSQRSVWVDCRHVSVLPAEALQLFRQFAARLWQQGGHLILCHLPDAIRAELIADTSQPLAASLLDADRYGLHCPDDLAG